VFSGSAPGGAIVASQAIITALAIGSQEAASIAAGRLDEIVAYCKRDVETTRAVYRRMRFIGQKPVGDQATGS